MRYRVMAVDLLIQARSLDRAADLIASAADARNVADITTIFNYRIFGNFLSILTDPISFWYGRRAASKATEYLARAPG